MTAARRFDPFAPAGAAFPERRLRRAGLDDAAVGALRASFDEMSAEERRELLRFVTRRPDSALRERFAARLSREQAERLTVDQLRERLDERPGGLSTSGRKAELVDRLLASYEPAGTSGPAEVPQEEPATETAPEPPAEAATVTEGAPTAPQDPPAESTDTDATPATDPDQEDSDRG